MPGLNVNERSLYTRKMIVEKNANRLVCVSSGRARSQAHHVHSFWLIFIECAKRVVI